MSPSGKVTRQVTQMSASEPSTRRSHLYPRESCNVESVAEIYTSPLEADDGDGFHGVAMR